MKKLLLFVSAIASVAYAQKAPRIQTFQELVKAPKVTSEVASEEKILGVTLWSDNFTDPANWIIDNSGQSGIEFGWNINNSSDGWWSANGITSTSGGNYAELVNGDPTASPGTQALNVTYTLTTAQPIDIANLGGNNQVSLQFQQYGARFNDLQEIQISTNGTTWVTVGNNLDKPVLSAAGGSAFANPDTKIINLATFLTATPSPIWVRFSWTTNYPGSATNPNVWVTYGWYIDDVKIVTNPTNDLSVTSSFWGSVGLPYYQIPDEQVTEIGFAADVFNGGVNTQTNVKLNINANNGAWTGSSAPVSITSLDTTSIELTTFYTPPATPGNISITRNISADSTDDIPANNALANIDFAITDFIYARDNGTPSGSTSNGTDGFESGNLFDVFQDATLKAIDVRMPGGANGATVGTEIFVKLYSIDATTGDFLFESESAPFVIASNNLNTILTLELEPYANVVAGTTYLAVVGAYSAGLRVSNAGKSDPQTTFFLDMADNTWYYSTNTPMVRMNFNPILSVAEQTEIAQAVVLPNPTTANATLRFDLQNTSDVVVVVTDIAGKTMQTNSYNQLTAGAQEITLGAEQWAAGIYTVNITSNGHSVTKKFVKR
ncbi:MAG: T9SS C-terminal target domain-containing protein [Flavobacteriia bacterium]|nr:T9SS C-terminal target domain-containing protein [Flavobacteriia bacterium]